MCKVFKLLRLPDFTKTTGGFGADAFRGKKVRAEGEKMGAEGEKLEATVGGTSESGCCVISCISDKFAAAGTSGLFLMSLARADGQTAADVTGC